MGLEPSAGRRIPAQQAEGVAVLRARRSHDARRRAEQASACAGVPEPPGASTLHQRDAASPAASGSSPRPVLVRRTASPPTPRTAAHVCNSHDEERCA